MNRFTFKLFKYLPHAVIALSLAVLTFVILNYFNPHLGFLSSGYSKTVFVLLGIAGIALAAVSIAFYRDISRKR